MFKNWSISLKLPYLISGVFLLSSLWSAFPFSNAALASKSKPVITNQILDMLAKVRQAEQATNCVRLRRNELTRDNLDFLGKGAFGSILKAQLCDNAGNYGTSLYAIKKVAYGVTPASNIKTQKMSAQIREEALQEAAVGALLTKHCPGLVVGAFEIHDDPTPGVQEITLLMDYAEHGTLWDYIQQKNKEKNAIELETAKRWLTQLSEGVFCMHAKAGYAQLDLSDENILLVTRPASNPPIIDARLSDFGKLMKTGTPQYDTARKRQWKALEIIVSEKLQSIGKTNSVITLLRKVSQTIKTHTGFRGVVPECLGKKQQPIFSEPCEAHLAFELRTILEED